MLSRRAPGRENHDKRSFWIREIHDPGTRIRAQDLVKSGIELPALMTAGRWRSSKMPARYTERQAADRGAVARYYQEKSDWYCTAELIQNVYGPNHTY